MAMMRPLQKWLAPLRRRVQLMIGRGVVRLVNDALMLQGVQVSVLADEVLDNVENFQRYGLTSVPHPGAEALVLSLGGNRSHAVVVAVDDRRWRKKGLAEGEVALYTSEGDYLHLKNGRIIEIVAGNRLKVTSPDVEVVAGTKVTLSTPLVEIAGNLQVAGTVSAIGAVSSSASVGDASGTMQAMRDTFNSHAHPGDSGGTTGAPNQTM